VTLWVGKTTSLEEPHQGASRVIKKFAHLD
jgi:hypothetical protein